MTSLLYIEIEHEKGEILSSAVGNIRGPFFLAHVTIKETLPNSHNLSSYLQKLEKEESVANAAENAFDNKESLKNIFQ